MICHQQTLQMLGELDYPPESNLAKCSASLGKPIPFCQNTVQEHWKGNPEGL